MLNGEDVLSCTFRKRAIQLVALLRKETCNLKHLRHSAAWNASNDNMLSADEEAQMQVTIRFFKKSASN